MKSIRHYLTWRLLIGLLFLIITGNTLLYLFIYYRTVSYFDAALEAKARAFAGMIEQDSEGVEVELRKEFLPEYNREYGAEYYQVWTEDGKVLERSPSLKGEDLPRRTGTFESPVIWNLTLPDGRPGRAIGISFSPFVEDEDLPLIKKRLVVQVVLAKDRVQISNILRVLFLGTVSLVVIIIIGIIMIVPRIIKSGLSPLRHLADYTSTIDSKSLSARYRNDYLPDELRPIVDRLNELLQRLEHAFVRQKRLTADIAHELKTPIAELRSMTDVALKWPDDTKFVNDTLTETCEIAKQMDRIVSTLLALSRCESGKQNIYPVTVNLKSMILDLWNPWQKMVDEKDIYVKFDLPESAEVITDKMMFSSILTNLFSNAAEYCPEGGYIECSLKPFPGRMILSIRNTNESLVEDDLPQMFEQLWRKDPARGDSLHSGLGLALVDAFAHYLAIEISTELLQSGDFCVTLVIPSVLPKN
jgi:two-component system sensor histidine kinase QseC